MRDIDDLIKWLEEIGIRQAGNNRLATYQRHLHGYLIAEAQGLALDFTHKIGRDEFYNAKFATKLGFSD